MLECGALQAVDTLDGSWWWMNQGYQAPSLFESAPIEPIFSQKGTAKVKYVQRQLYLDSYWNWESTARMRLEEWYINSMIWFNVLTNAMQ
eukprot:gene12836-13645_t